jgi:regulator of sigma E protease
VGDPFTLGPRVQQRAGQTIAVVVKREGREMELPVTPRLPEQIAGPYNPNYPLGIEELGIAFHVQNEVTEVVPESPADQAGLRAGDTIESVEISIPKQEPKEKPSLVGRFFAGVKGLFSSSSSEKELTEQVLLDAERQSWPYVHTFLQTAAPGTTFTLHYSRGGKIASATVEPIVSTEFFNPQRGLVLTRPAQMHQASSFSEAMWLGYRESKEKMQEVMTTLWMLLSGQLSVTNLAGPGGIAYVAGVEASQGLGNLLIFLTFLSVNLAIINSLPIPVLDGGHFVFLAVEGIRGKPLSEAWVMRLSFAGLIFLLSLMLFVTTLDIGRFTGVVQ